MHPYAVCCTAEVLTSVVDKFLSSALAGAEASASNSDYSLGLVTTTTTTADGDQLSVPDVASKPPVAAFTSPVVGRSVQDVLQRLEGVSFFAVLDQRSVEDECTAVLAARQPDDTVQTVRVTFDRAQSLLTALDVATIGFGEIRDAAESEGGVYGAGPEKSIRRGEPAPRKQLRREV